jgi:hypothetical protein
LSSAKGQSHFVPFICGVPFSPYGVMVVRGIDFSSLFFPFFFWHYIILLCEGRGLLPDLHSLFFFLSERKKLGLGRSLHRPIIHYSGQKESAKALLFFALMAIFRWQHAQVITWKLTGKTEQNGHERSCSKLSYCIFSTMYRICNKAACTY